MALYLFHCNGFHLLNSFAPVFALQVTASAQIKDWIIDPGKFLFRSSDLQTNSKQFQLVQTFSM